MRIRNLAFTAVVGVATLSGAVKQISPPGIQIAGPYSPGVLTDRFLYVAGQGAKDASGRIPDDMEGQARNVLENIKTIVQAAGLTMEHVVYTQVYLTNYSDEVAVDRVFRQYFPNNPPARSTIGVAKLPGTPLEISAVAIRDLSKKRVILPAADAGRSAGVIAGDRVYISGHVGPPSADAAEQVNMALAGIEQTIKAAGLDLRHLVFVNPYLTSAIPMSVMNKVYASRFEFGNTPARATIQVAGLPNGAHIEFTGVAVTDISKRRAVRPKNMEPSPTASPCVFAGNTLFCSAKSGFIPGVNGGIYASTIETQLRQTMRNLLDGLEEAGMDFSNVVASNVYLDNVEDFARMNAVYAEYFGKIPPARTTVQQIAPGDRSPSAKGHYPTLEQISIVAEK